MGYRRRGYNRVDFERKNTDLAAVARQNYERGIAAYKEYIRTHSQQPAAVNGRKITQPQFEPAVPFI